MQPKDPEYEQVLRSKHKGGIVGQDKTEWRGEGKQHAILIKINLCCGVIGCVNTLQFHNRLCGI